MVIYIYIHRTSNNSAKLPLPHRAHEDTLSGPAESLRALGPIGMSEAAINHSQKRRKNDLSPTQFERTRATIHTFPAASYRQSAVAMRHVFCSRQSQNWNLRRFNGFYAPCYQSCFTTSRQPSPITLAHPPRNCRIYASSGWQICYRQHGSELALQARKPTPHLEAWLSVRFSRRCHPNTASGPWMAWPHAAIVRSSTSYCSSLRR